MLEVCSIHFLASLVLRHDQLRLLHRLELGVHAGKRDAREVGKFSNRSTLLLSPQKGQQAPSNLRCDEVLEHVLMLSLIMIKSRYHES